MWEVKERQERRKEGQRRTKREAESKGWVGKKTARVDTFYNNNSTI